MELVERYVERYVRMAVLHFSVMLTLPCLHAFLLYYAWYLYHIREHIPPSPSAIALQAHGFPFLEDTLHNSQDVVSDYAIRVHQLKLWLYWASFQGISPADLP